MSNETFRERVQLYAEQLQILNPSGLTPEGVTNVVASSVQLGLIATRNEEPNLSAWASLAECVGTHGPCFKAWKNQKRQWRSLPQPAKFLHYVGPTFIEAAIDLYTDMATCIWSAVDFDMQLEDATAWQGNFEQLTQAFTRIRIPVDRFESQALADLVFFSLQCDSLESSGVAAWSDWIEKRTCRELFGYDWATIKKPGKQAELGINVEASTNNRLFRYRKSKQVETSRTPDFAD